MSEDSLRGGQNCRREVLSIPSMRRISSEVKPRTDGIVSVLIYNAVDSILNFLGAHCLSMFSSLQQVCRYRLNCGAENSLQKPRSAVGDENEPWNTHNISHHGCLLIEVRVGRALVSHSCVFLHR
jgi:hypothetical protein